MSQYVKSTYEYSKTRKDFGRQPLFQTVQAHMLDSINTDKQLHRLYGLRNPVHQTVQATKSQSEHFSNTKQTKTREQGINHTEGGWPREILPDNEDLVLRHRRRVMHDENYINSVLSLAPAVTHYIAQNNAIEMYQTYFSDMHPQEPKEKCNVRVSNIFRDPDERPVSCIAWTIEHQSKLAVSYYNTDIPIFQSQEIYLWDINRQISPLQCLEPPSPCWRLACSPVDPEILVAGLKSGITSVFDIREGTQPVSSSSVYNSHRDAITGLLYIHSRTSTEFYTGSPDGQCLWWDLRNLSEPKYQLPMSVRLNPGQMPNLGNAEGVSTTEYDRGIPTKFLCGTESGLVISGNRMGKTHSEILYAYWEAQLGPVRALHRSPCTPRMFITCGDWTVNIWSDEVRNEPIIGTPSYPQQVTDVVWSPQRFSSYMVVCENGVFYYWDLLRKSKESVISLQVSKQALTNITPSLDGENVAVGDINGSVFLLQLSDNMILPGPRDKALMTQIYGRQTRREHILEARLREIHLKKRAEEEVTSEMSEPEVLDEEDIDRAAEEEYFKIVKEELRKMEGLLAQSDILND